jgi:hypothetical protein
VYLSPEEAVQLKLRQVARFREPACNVFSKRVWEHVGGYSKQFRFCFDVHFNTRVMAEVPSALISEEWCELRRHQGSDGAKLPANLALAELEELVMVSLGLIKPSATARDKRYGQAMVAYRVLELALARANGSIPKALAFIWEHKARLPVSPSGLSIVAGTLYRRLKMGDVQKSLPSSADVHHFK